MGAPVFAAFFVATVLGLACATTPAPQAPIEPKARTPAEAAALARDEKSAAVAVDLAWLEGNDRVYARERLDQALATSPNKTPLLLRRALLSFAELDPASATTDLLAVIRAAPKSGEAEIALVLLYEWLAELELEHARIADALRAVSQWGPRQAILSSALRLELAERVATTDSEARSLWLTELRVVGPLGPLDDRLLAETTDFEKRSVWGTPKPYRGFVPPIRELTADGRSLEPALAGRAGLYVLDGYFEVRSKEPVVAILQAHLPSAARVLVDGQPALSRSVLARRGHRVHETQLRLSPGWHRLTVPILATNASQPSFALLGADGTPLVLKQTSVPAQLARPASVGPIDRTSNDPTLAFGVLEAWRAQPEHTLFARWLGGMLALSRWYDDADLAREWMDSLPVQGAQSAQVQLALARLAAWSRLPETEYQPLMRQATLLDPTHPVALVALARLVARDDPEQAMALLLRAESVAPNSNVPIWAQFRLHRQRGWNAEAYAQLVRAMQRGLSRSAQQEAIDFARSQERYLEAQQWEDKLIAASGKEAPQIEAQRALRQGDLTKARQALSQTQPRRPDSQLRLAELAFAEGDLAAARQAASAALSINPLSPNALRLLFQLGLATDWGLASQSLSELRRLDASDVRLEALWAQAQKEPLGVPPYPWLLEAQKFDPWPLIRPAPGATVPRGLDPADRYSSHKSVILLDRVVDTVQPGGRALSLRHVVQRLQTKEATDEVGEIALPEDALPLRLRTLKADGRVIDVDRHAGKEDLSFSALAPGDAVEKQWVTLEGAATAWGGYLRRFYFRSTSPVVRADYTVVVPTGTTVWHRSYHGAPPPRIQQEGAFTLYAWLAEDIAALEPEPMAAPPDEYVPFVVVAVGVDQDLALKSQSLGLSRATQSAHHIDQLARQLTAHLTDPEAQARALFNWVNQKIQPGNERDPGITLLTQRGQRTNLLVAMLRALDLEAELVLARPGNAPKIEPPYPHLGSLSQELVKITLNSKVVWARIDTKAAWMGLLGPTFRGGEYLVERDGALRTLPFPDQQVDVWGLASDIVLTVDEDGTAQGTLTLTLPGTMGGDLKEFIRGARPEDIQRQIQGWLGATLPGTRLVRFENRGTEPDADAQAPLVLISQVVVDNFFTRDGQHLVAEQFFNQPLGV